MIEEGTTNDLTPASLGLPEKFRVLAISSTSRINVHIPQLEERGVKVNW